MPKYILIDYKNVDFFYKQTQVLFDINLTINKGQSVAIVGHNGAGKTTLIKLLIGVLQPSSGAINSIEYVQTNKLSFMPEHNALYSHLSGIELMRYFAKLKGVEPSNINEILKLVEIDFAAHKKISQYSKGMKQRLMLAQALLSDPEILILDEPYSGLDPNSKRLFSRILQNLSVKNKSIILSSHTLEGLSDIVDNVIFIKKGRVTLSGKIKTIIKNLGLNDKMQLTLDKGVSADEIIKSVQSLITSHTLLNNELILLYKTINNIALLKIIVNITSIQDIVITKANVNDAYYHIYNKS
jgi:Cu-processing system ATP-binding protein